jgi:hypothetical protein
MPPVACHADRAPARLPAISHKPEASDLFQKNDKLSLMQDIGKLVVLIGAILIVVGFCLWKLPGLFGWVGRLPGDISVQKGNFSFYFPIVTCILISVVLTLLSWLFRR